MRGSIVLNSTQVLDLDVRRGARKQRPGSGMILGMTTRTTPKPVVVGVEFQMSPEQREALKAEALENNVSMQELLELRVFGELRPRLRRRRRGVSEGQELLSA